MLKRKQRTPAVERIHVPSPMTEGGTISNVLCFRIQTNVTLETLLEPTIGDDPQLRIDAIEGIKDHMKERGYLSDNFKKNEKAIYEKLCRGITDTDNGVREAAYEALLMVKHLATFEDYIPTVFVPSVVEALQHSEMDIHLTGRKVADMLLRQIPSSFYLFVRKIFQILEYMMKDEQKCSDVHLLRIFQSVNFCLSSMPNVGKNYEICFDKKSLGVLKSVLSIFPRSWNQHSSVVGDSKHFDIDIEVTKIFFRLPKLSDSEKILAFINYALHKMTESNVEELLAFFPPYVPKLVSSDLPSHSQANLIQAFTVGFQTSRPESKFKSASVTFIEQMMPGRTIQDVNRELFHNCRREWIDELLKLLPLLGHENKCTSQAALRTLLMACSSTDFEAVEKPLLHQAFCWLFQGEDRRGSLFSSILPEEMGQKSLFSSIPKDMQQKCLRLLQYFPVLDVHLLKSLARYCVRCSMKCLREIVSTLDEYYRSGQHEQADGFSLFFSLLVSENEDYYKDKSITMLPNKSDTDYLDIILPKLRYDESELSRFVSVSNHHRSQYVVLRLVAQLDTSLEKSSPEFVANLSNFTADYMIEVTYLREYRFGDRAHCLWPCFTLMKCNTKFLGLILDEIIKYVEAQCRSHECIDKMIAVTELVALIRDDRFLTQPMLTFGEKLDRIKSSLISFKYYVDENFESVPIKNYHKLCLALQQLMT